MSQAQAQTYSFLVCAPDYPDVPATNRRAATRAQHVEHMGKLGKDGVLRTGGGMLAPDEYGAVERTVRGSIMIFECESLDAVRKIIEEDVYWTTLVWDHERLSIIPFFSPAPVPALMA
ncbi:hypothetical protein BDW22DRAFT_1334556 [Trametopsis cervina]|nr:hypothetical protein BDW22DRAFT_1334556 [Trametopsis cervina]